MPLKLKFSPPPNDKACAEAAVGLISNRMTRLKQLSCSVLLASVATIGVAQTTEEDIAAVPDVAADTELVAAEGAATEPELQTIISASDTTLEEWLWLKRPVIVFADSAADPRYIEQIGLITQRLDALTLRDVIVITDTDPGNPSDVRKKLRARGFMLVVMAKDGTIVTRKPAPWDVREISRSIDKLPLRKQEIRDRRDTLRP